jgi:hypothetical protein
MSFEFFFLKINFIAHNIYVDYLSKLVRNGRYDKALAGIERTAKLYSKTYIGILASNRLENLLTKIGECCIGFNGQLQQSLSNGKALKILHVATEFYDVGGHTRVVRDWIKDDLDNQHEILLTNQVADFNLEIPALFNLLEGESHIDKAKKLRAFIFERGYNKIVIHQHMHDVIISLALWDFKINAKSIDVLFYVHSDFKFSLGNNICTKRISFSEINKNISARFRPKVGQDYILQFPLDNQFFKATNLTYKLKAKEKLGISIQKNVFISVASKYKYKPYKNINFLKEWDNFLLSQKNSLLIVIGCDENDFKEFCATEKKSKNLMLLGYKNDIHDYYLASDYVVNP